MLIPADSAVQAWLQTLTAWPVPLGVAAGFRMAASTTVVMLVLELLSLDVAIGLARKSPSLYAQAWAATLRNNFLLGPAVYYVAQEFFCWPALPPASSAVAAVALVLVHAAGYYTAHRLMHTKALYWAHSFHHQFSTHVVPSASNAVSLTEYAIAYMLPFVVGCVVCRPDALALYAAVSLISANNLLIHTPRLEALAAALLPSVFVSTGGRGHLEHHRKLTKNYAAPTLNLDRLLAASPTLTRAADAFFLALGGKPVAVSNKAA